MDALQSFVQGPIDFKGQKLADTLNFNILTVGAVLTVLGGFVTQNILVALYISLASCVAALILVVPPWSWFNRNPVTWLSPPGVDVSSISIS